jgi:isopenicillin-N epimerase
MHRIGGRGFWVLDPKVTFLNHGSFGACPRPVLKFQRNIQDQMERQPMRFFVDEFEARWDEARRTVAKFVGAKVNDLVFVPDATFGVNTVLRSLRFKSGDELLVTDHEYNACRNALNCVAKDSGARVVVMRIPFPLKSSDEVLEAVLRGVTRRTRLALLDHVTSSTALVLPMARLVRELAARGVETLVDGAHGPGMLPLNLGKLGAAYYTGNCHKWLCAPKGAAFLLVRSDLQPLVRPLVISHGANSPRTDRSRFLIEFGWMGTDDPSAWLSVPEAWRCIGGLLPGGWPDVMRRNRELALAARRHFCNALDIAPPAPEDMIGAMASIPLPDGKSSGRYAILHGLDELREQLREEFGIEVPVFPWPAPPKRLLRISAQLYNGTPDYVKLAAAVATLLGRSAKPSSETKPRAGSNRR